MDRDLAKFVELIKGACAEVGDAYFQLPQATGDRAYRERVYCYELYHQMRLKWEEFPYSLGGEVDKSGHPVFRDGPYCHSKPDFLVHIPGDMGDNLAIVEVKASTAKLSAMQSDIGKLRWFCGPPARYFAGILLVYGDESRFDEQWHELETKRSDGREVHRIVILRHSAVGEPANVVTAAL